MNKEMENKPQNIEDVNEVNEDTKKKLNADESYDIPKDISKEADYFNTKIENGQFRLNELQRNATEIQEDIQKKQNELYSLINEYALSEFGLGVEQINKTHAINVVEGKIKPKNK